MLPYKDNTQGQQKKLNLGYKYYHEATMTSYDPSKLISAGQITWGTRSLK